MEEVSVPEKIEETTIDVELLELPFLFASDAEFREEGGDELEMIVKRELNSIPWKAYKHFTISRIPDQIRERNKTLYEPGIVSIGPYYHGNEALRAMEEHKWRFLQSFLARTGVGMTVYLKEMRALEPLARRCYRESISLGPDEFALMLLLDGCFILEYLERLGKWEVFQFCEFGWSFETLLYDLFLLENQIPFFVIHKLNVLRLDGICKNDSMLLRLIFRSLPRQNWLTPPLISCNKIDHLLHFYYKCIVPDMNYGNPNRNHPRSRKERIISWIKANRFSCTRPTQTNSQSQKVHVERDRVIHCATKLHEAGVKFKKKNNPSNLFDITFKNGVLEMPYMAIDPYLRVIFTNFFAYEQSRSMVRGVFTSFTTLMDALVNTEKDVVLLEKCGVIDNMLQNEDEAAVFFNELNDFGVLNYSNHYFVELFGQVQKYSDSALPRYRAKLMQEYFSNPWTSISVVAGIVLLFLTGVQAFFAVYPTFHQS